VWAKHDKASTRAEAWFIGNAFGKEAQTTARNSVSTIVGRVCDIRILGSAWTVATLGAGRALVRLHSSLGWFMAFEKATLTECIYL
jgi:hypothetical protein